MSQWYLFHFAPCIEGHIPQVFGNVDPGPCGLLRVIRQGALSGPRWNAGVKKEWRVIVVYQPVLYGLDGDYLTGQTRNLVIYHFPFTHLFFL